MPSDGGKEKLCVTFSVYYAHVHCVTPPFFPVPSSFTPRQTVPLTAPSGWPPAEFVHPSGSHVLILALLTTLCNPDKPQSHPITITLGRVSHGPGVRDEPYKTSWAVLLYYAVLMFIYYVQLTALFISNVWPFPLFDGVRVKYLYPSIELCSARKCLASWYTVLLCPLVLIPA